MTEKIIPKHAALERLRGEHGQLLLGGIPIERLVARAGQTPFYVYVRDELSARVEFLRKRLPESMHLHYAMKANPMPAVVQHLAGLVDGLDVASAREMKVALEAGMSPENISFAGPGKSESELSQAHAARIVVNVESEREIQILEWLAKETGEKANVAIRVNPDFELKASGMKMAGGPKQFGIDAERVPAVLKSLSENVAFMGFHIFSGSQNLRADAIIEAQQKAVDLAVDLSQHAPCAPRHVNIGGGFGIPYFPGEENLDVEAVTAQMPNLLAKAATELGGAKLVIELGRYLVGEAGYYVCKILDKKISRDQIFLVVDGGLHHHLSASGNFGQVIRKNYPVIVANRFGVSQEEKVNVVGPLCTPLDVLGDKMMLPVASEGDFIVVLQSGAYGYSASPRDFLSQTECLELLI